jgi:hypothetical protein
MCPIETPWETNPSPEPRERKFYSLEELIPQERRTTNENIPQKFLLLKTLLEDIEARLERQKKTLHEEVPSPEKETLYDAFLDSTCVPFVKDALQRYIPPLAIITLLREFQSPQEETPPFLEGEGFSLYRGTLLDKTPPPSFVIGEIAYAGDNRKGDPDQLPGERPPSGDRIQLAHRHIEDGSLLHIDISDVSNHGIRAEATAQVLFELYHSLPCKTIQERKQRALIVSTYLNSVAEDDIFETNISIVAEQKTESETTHLSILNDGHIPPFIIDRDPSTGQIFLASDLSIEKTHSLRSLSNDTIQGFPIGLKELGEDSPPFNIEVSNQAVLIVTTDGPLEIHPTAFSKPIEKYIPTLFTQALKALPETSSVHDVAVLFLQKFETVYNNFRYISEGFDDATLVMIDFSLLNETSPQ